MSFIVSASRRRSANVRLNCHILEFAHTTRNAYLRGQAFDAGSPKEADNAFGMREDILGILGLGDWASMAQNENIGPFFLGGVGDGLHLFGGLVQAQRRVGSNGPLG